MTSFEDGPAKDQTLMLRRAARFLRVVQSHDGKFDALDQPYDMPRPTETLYAYEIVARPVMTHLRMSKPGVSGFYPMARYRLVPEQPSQNVMRYDWQKWCESQPAREI